MAKYLFEEKEIEIIDPEIIKHGFVGSSYENNNLNGVFEVTLKLKTDNVTAIVKISDTSMPTSFHRDHIDEWISKQIEKYKIIE